MAATASVRRVAGSTLSYRSGKTDRSANCRGAIPSKITAPTRSGLFPLVIAIAMAASQIVKKTAVRTVGYADPATIITRQRASVR